MKKEVLAVISIFAFVGAFFALGVPAKLGITGFATGSKKEPDLRYGGQYYPGEFLLKGKPELWAKYNLSVEHVLFSSGAENNKALVAGDIDANCGSDSKTMSLFNSIPDKALIIGTVQRGNRYATVVRKNSSYDSWEDLKGKKIATRFGTGAEGVLRRFYEEKGYNWNDFDYVNMKIEDMINALKSGRIKAFTAWEPTPAIAEAQGVGKVMKTYGDVALVPASIHTTKKFAGNHEEELTRFLAVQLEKAELIEENPEKAAELASQAAEEKGIKVSPEAFERVFKRINFQISFNKTIIEEIRDTARFLKQQGEITKIPEFSWNRSYLEKAKELKARKS